MAESTGSETENGASQPSPAKSRFSLLPKTWPNALMFVVLPLLGVLVAVGVAYRAFGGFESKLSEAVQTQASTAALAQATPPTDLNIFGNLEDRIRNGDIARSIEDGIDRFGDELERYLNDLWGGTEIEDPNERFDRDEICEDNRGRNCYDLRDIDPRYADEFCDRFFERGRANRECLNRILSRR